MPKTGITGIAAMQARSPWTMPAPKLDTSDYQ